MELTDAEDCHLIHFLRHCDRRYISDRAFQIGC